ncbi:TetR family transcriptional regulator [Amycolatopsis rhabdoformis]|uniref:TetR family transcriptional regulator n=1 Tax=Amycolatopsis rhabdoformis TaxID=1448059 RepID=A0ABZ1IFF9_9PSEU|nr:TetR family transcriptional regulator [Amycolatopsis rhabdoformis]WSE32438.1 TetR family transcriptional regulator [Amycolatopsis rhabdoformis]
MAEPERAVRSTRLTARGEATRARILEAAVDLMSVKGVAATTLDDVRAASGTSKSQLYHHFEDKDALVQEVIGRRAQVLLAWHEEQLGRLNSMRGLERWRDAVLQHNALRNGAYGCPLGSMASELSDRNERARSELASHFERWEGLVADGLERMRVAGKLRPDTDPQRLAIGLIGALQGGYLLAQTKQDVAPMKVALDMAIDCIRAFKA